MAKNPQLKQAFSTNEYSAEQIVELKRCINDPIYFMQNYVRVIDPKKGAVPFDLFEYQVEMVHTVHNNKDTVILASRQLGKCVSSLTTLNSIERPTGLRKLLLKVLDRNTYDNLFSTSNQEMS